MRRVPVSSVGYNSHYETKSMHKYNDYDDKQLYIFKTKNKKQKNTKTK